MILHDTNSLFELFTRVRITVLLMVVSRYVGFIYLPGLSGYVGFCHAMICKRGLLVAPAVSVLLSVTFVYVL